MEDKHPELWCRFEITNMYTFIMQCVFYFVLIATMLFIVYSAIRLLQKKKLRHTITIYMTLFCWIVCFMIKTALGMITYYLFMWKDVQQTQENFTLKILSAVFDSFDRLTTFFLMTLMLKIPYLWLKNILKAFKQTQSSSFTVSDRVFIHRSYKILEFLKKYIYARNILLILLASSCLLLFNNELLCTIQIFISIAPFILQSLLLIFAYSFGHYFLIRLSSYIHAEQSSLRKIKNQYMALSVSSVVRIVFIVLLNVTQPQRFDYIATPNCVSKTQDEKISRTVVLAIAMFLCHIIPALIIVFIYSQSPRDKKHNRGSLLDTSQHSFDQQYQNTSSLRSND